MFQKLDYKTAKENFLTSHFDGCQKFFVEHGCILELAYYEILAENLSEAEKLFSLIQEQDLRASWGKYLVSMLKINVNSYPSYFQLRNFLEIDLNILIQNAKGQYVQNILGYTDFMSEINPEVYKFIGRVFYHNGLKEESMILFEHAKDTFFNDPELHVLIAQLYLENGNKEKALHYATISQKILPEYYPAVSLTKQLIAQD